MPLQEFEHSAFVEESKDTGDGTTIIVFTVFPVQAPVEPLREYVVVTLELTTMLEVFEPLLQE